jgi:hypothetical protein
LGTGSRRAFARHGVRALGNRERPLHAPGPTESPALIAQLRASQDCEIVAATEALFNEGLDLHAQRPDKEWSLTDCISFIVMPRRSVRRALTPDHHFEQAGFEALLRHDPP